MFGRPMTPLLVTKTPAEDRLAELLDPSIQGMGYRLVRLRLLGSGGADAALTLQIMAERPDGTMSVDDCEQISKALSPVLDVEDPVAQAYNLELSSPGIDRPLVRRSDFEIWSGHVAKIETAYLLDGRKRFRGHIVKVEGEGVLIRRDNAAKGEEKEVTIPFEAISTANLVLTDELIREALVRDKALRKANGMDADEDGAEE